MSVYDTYDFVVTPTSSKQQLWEPTGVGNGVRPVRYAYENLKVEVHTRGGSEKVGFVVGSAEFREGQRKPLRDATCEINFARLTARHPDLRGVLIVTGSFLEEVVRGKGVGVAMYRVLAEHAGKQGLAIVPEYCWSGTALTSEDALRVWGKLAREPGFDAEGHTVYAPPVRANPRRRRAPHPQVSTPAFQRWFGDSKVVDAEGQPLVMYHGTSVANFDAFSTLRPPFFTSDKNYAKMYSDKGRGGKAREVEVFLRIERPFDTRHDAQAVRLFNADFLPWYREQQQRYAHLRERDIPPAVLGEALPFPSADDFWRYLRIRSRRGDTPYDGLVVDEGSFPATWEEATERKLTPDAQYAWVPLDPTQIKSAKKNAGTFDPDDPSILRNPRKKRVDPVLDPRHLTIIETPAFKRWFRDSKVVDRLGRPLVVYHGSPDIRDVFGGMTTIRAPSAFFATDSYAVAGTYARGKAPWDYQNAEPGVVPLFLSIQNPMVVDARGARWRKTEPHIAQAYRDGHDGIIILNSVDDYRGSGGAGLATVYVWFDPRQAKSAVLDEMRSWVDGKPLTFATPNAGTFDPEDADMRKNPRRRRAPHPQVSAPAFRRWFGKSRVVDAKGQPLVVYHGTCGDFSVFDPERADTTAGTGVPFGTFFFTSMPEVADTYARDMRRRYCLGASTMPVYLSLQDPLIVDLTKWAHAPSWNRIPYRNREWTINTLTEHALRRGYDGLIVKGVWDTGLGKPRKGRGVGDTYVAFAPEQIKSAIGNRGTFDPDDADITRNNPRRRR